MPLLVCSILLFLWALADERNYLAGVPRTGKTLGAISKAVKGTPCERGCDRALLGTEAGYDAIELRCVYLVDSVLRLHSIPFHTHISPPRSPSALLIMYFVHVENSFLYPWTVLYSAEIGERNKKYKDATRCEFPRG